MMLYVVFHNIGKQYVNQTYYLNMCHVSGNTFSSLMTNVQSFISNIRLVFRYTISHFVMVVGMVTEFGPFFLSFERKTCGTFRLSSHPHRFDEKKTLW